MTTAARSIQDLYKVRAGDVDFVDVPELAYAVVEGTGGPDGAGYPAALQALFSVSYGAHFLVKRSYGTAPRVMPLETLWWVDDADLQIAVSGVATGVGSMAEVDRSRWRWQAMIAQPPPIDRHVLDDAVARAVAKAVPSLDLVRLVRWEEGRCAQLLHVGPYADEAPSIVRLHRAIADAGCRPCGRHHEIYLGDPRRSAPERLRTILRQPVEPA